MARVTQTIAIERLRAAIGDSYDFSKTVYVNATTKMTVTCFDHGEFSRLPAVFWKGSGCHACSFKNRIGIDEVLARFITTHGDRYDYSKVTYTHSEKQVSIGCQNHGVFFKTPAAHWNGSGCPSCLKGTARPHRLTTKKALQKFITVHGDKYDYSRTRYELSNVPVEIICRRHGVFEQTPNSHLNGNGCSRCTNPVSKPESSWADALEEATGWKIDRNKKVQSIRRGVDMCLEDTPFGKLAIEYDGCYWHSRNGSIKNDERKSLLLADAGYKVVRLREKGSHVLDPLPNIFLNFWVKPKPSIEQIAQLMDSLTSASGQT